MAKLEINYKHLFVRYSHGCENNGQTIGVGACRCCTSIVESLSNLSGFWEGRERRAMEQGQGLAGGDPGEIAEDPSAPQGTCINFSHH